jgi:cytochrome c oxidase subunit 1
MMLAGALFLILNLTLMHRGQAGIDRHVQYAVAVHPPGRLPTALNGFAIWNVIVTVLMLVAYGYPIWQFFWLNAPQPVIHQFSQ